MYMYTSLKNKLSRVFENIQITAALYLTAENRTLSRTMIQGTRDDKIKNDFGFQIFFNSGILLGKKISHNLSNTFFGCGLI